MNVTNRKHMYVYLFKWMEKTRIQFDICVFETVQISDNGLYYATLFDRDKKIF